MGYINHVDLVDENGSTSEDKEEVKLTEALRVNWMSLWWVEDVGDFDKLRRLPVDLPNVLQQLSIWSINLQNFHRASNPTTCFFLLSRAYRVVPKDRVCMTR